ncbi:MAG: NAD(P)H-hydrate dehydratase [Balneolaceae bacterium]
MENNNLIPQHLHLSGSEQSRESDRKTIEEFGIDGFTLMEIAASKAASFIHEKEGDHQQGVFICGKGNNAGDALAAARYLTDQAGHHVKICFILGDSGLSSDAEKNLGLLKKLKKQGSDVTFLENVTDTDLRSAGYIVDGLFGTGLKSSLRDPLPEVIEKLNSSGKRIYSMDVPSGLHADTGLIQGNCVRADFTLTFGTNKIGFYLNRGREFTGEIVFLSLPFPRYLLQKDAVLVNSDLQEALPEIARHAKHKYDNGVVHVLAGSEGLTGAAIMTAKSAWKNGAGAVFLYAPGKLLPVYESALPQIIKIAVGSKDDSYLKSSHAEKILEHLSDKPGVVIAGPGTGIRDETGTCLLNILSEFQGKVVIDADALSFWSELKTLPDEKKKNWVLTPHPGEAKKYLQGNFNDDFERLNWIKNFVQEHNCTILSKGNPVLLASSQKETYITEYDTSVFSRAGFGDVLTGTIGCNIGIRNETVRSTISALNKGYEAYLQSNKSEVFGPEHLL